MSFWQLSGVAPLPTPPVLPVLYGALGSTETTSDLYTIDPDTGAATSVGASGFAITGLSFRPSDGVLFGVTSNNSGSNPRALITVDPVTGSGTLVGALGVTSGLADIAFRSDDALYGYSPSDRTLYSVNTTTGAATQVSATAIPTSGFGYGLAFDAADVLFVFPKGNVGVFYIVDETTGGLTAQTALSGSGFSNGIINSATFDADGLAWVGFSTATGPAWYIATVDVTTSVMADVGQTADFLDALAWEPA